MSCDQFRASNQNAGALTRLVSPTHPLPPPPRAITLPHSSLTNYSLISTCLAVERVARFVQLDFDSMRTRADLHCRVSARAAPSVTARFSVTTSRVSPSRYVTRHMVCCCLSDKLTFPCGNITGYPPSCPSWWCQAYLRSHLRRDPWCSQDLP